MIINKDMLRCTSSDFLFIICRWNCRIFITQRYIAEGRLDELPWMLNEFFNRSALKTKRNAIVEAAESLLGCQAWDWDGIITITYFFVALLHPIYYHVSLRVFLISSDKQISLYWSAGIIEVRVNFLHGTSLAIYLRACMYLTIIQGDNNSWSTGDVN